MAKIVTLGELLVRLSTEKHTRLQNGSNLHLYFGGSEINVGVSLANFGHEVYAITALPKDQMGHSALQFLHTYGVKTDFLIYKEGRIGTYYVESGAGNRSSNVLYDRTHSVFSQIKELPFNLEIIFSDCDLFFVSGITLALNPALCELVFSVIKVARKMGVRIAFDINYREKLWPDRETAFTTMQRFLPLIEILSAGILDLRELLNDDTIQDLSLGYQQLQTMYSNLDIIFSTNRTTFASGAYEISGNVYMNNKLYQTSTESLVHVVDRIGSGDAYAAGILHGVLVKLSPEKMVAFATQATILKHTISGDVNNFSETDVLMALDMRPQDIRR